MAIMIDFAYLTDVVISAGGEDVFRIPGKIRIRLVPRKPKDDELKIVNLRDGGEWGGTLIIEKMKPEEAKP